MAMASAARADFYVATDGRDTNPGTKAKPFATLEKARDAVRALKKAGGLPKGGARVLIRGGRYFLSQPLRLAPEDSGTKDSPIVYAAAAGEQPVISGGRAVSGWKHVKDSLWTAGLADVRAGTWYFRQLFADGKRLTRARIPSKGFLTTVGPLSKYAERAKRRWGGYRGMSGLRKSHPEAYCGFRFKPGDIQAWPRCHDAEIITYHSWECSWQTIRKIDPEKHDVYFNSPCRYPVGFFSNRCRYRIENIPEALDQPGEWYLDRQTGVLSYLARPGEEPPKMDFVAPAIEKLAVLEGDAKAGTLVEHVRFSGLSFQHARYPMGIYDVAPDWPKPALKAHPDWPKTFAPGYTDSQAAPRCGQAIELVAARHCAIEHCEIAHVGAYAMLIGRSSHHNRIVGCAIHDAGGGGVLIGMDVRDVRKAKVPREAAPSHNLVANCLIRHCGIVHPSAVGIWIAQSHHNTAAHNELSDMGYSGISLGWNWNRGPNYSDHNTIEANHIHHVLEALADGGGIYTLGVLEGCTLRANYIHDISRPRGAIGSHNNGMFLDEGSQALRIERNVIRRIGHAPVRHNRNTKGDHTWVDNDFDPGDKPVAALNGVIQQAGPEPAYRRKFDSLTRTSP